MMRKRDFLGERVPAIVFAHWRGRPLYIFLVYLLGQSMIDPPSFLLTVLFLAFVTRLPLQRFVGPVAALIGGMIVVVYVFYHVLTPTIRRFLATLIADELPGQALATAAWREALAFPPRVVGWVAVVSVVVYTLSTVLFTPRFGFSLALIGSVVGLTATVGLTQVIFLFYLEWAMAPVARLALAAGARPELEELQAVRLPLWLKLLLLILLIVIVPVTGLGLFGYSQVVALGGDAADSLRLTALAASLASGVAALMVFILVRSVSAPMREIQRVAEAVGRGNLDVSIRPWTADEFSELGLRFNDMVAELRQQERLKAAFGRYVSEAVRDGILEGQISLGGERRELSILFTDIRNFTAWCEETPPETVIQTLNSYYENLIQALIQHGGTVTRYTGDGVLALFGAPLLDPDHALHAVRAAWEAYCLLEKFNAIRRSVDAFELHTGFGIHTGVAVVGSIGCEARAEYTPIGDAANVASRIEGLNRDLGTTILISEATYRQVNGRIVTGKRAETPVKGRSRPVHVVEVVGLGDDG
jgi:class 3 adenylate cyclase